MKPMIITMSMRRTDGSLTNGVLRNNSDTMEEKYFVPPDSKSRDLCITGSWEDNFCILHTHMYTSIYLYIPFTLSIYIILLSSSIYSNKTKRRQEDVGDQSSSILHNLQ